MKFLTLIIMLFLGSFANGKSIKSTFFSFENTGSNFTFYLNSWFGFGSSGNCPKVEFFMDSRSNDTLYIAAYYGLNHTALMGCGSYDTIKFANPYVGINYINVSSSAIVFYTDTSRNEHDTTFILGGTAINEHQNKETISLYPNPASQYISIQNNGWQEAVVHNELGQAVLQQEKTTQQQEQLDIHSLPVGHYFLMLYDKRKNKMGMGRFYKQTD